MTPELPLDLAHASLAPGFKTLLRQAASNPLALAQLSLQLIGRGEHDQAFRLAEHALAMAPENGEIRTIAAGVRAARIPDWHFSIVKDDVRNRAYDSAIRRAVRPGTRVLDIGAGTGLLAMMAARAGAAEVISCEVNPAAAAAAEEIVAANGLAGRIRIVAKHSDALDLNDLGGPADLIISEIVSNDLIGEHALPALEKVGRKLAAPDARFIPARAGIRIALAWDDQLARRQIGQASGFDLSPFDRLAKPLYQVKTDAGRISLRGPSADLFTFGFRTGANYRADRTSVELEATNGPINGIVQWIRLELDEDTIYENAPDCGFRSCWAMLFHALPQPIETTSGQRISIGASHDTVSLRLWTE